jgi:hypothetical protein
VEESGTLGVFLHWMDGWMDGLINGIIRIGFLIQWKYLEHLELSTGGWMTG